MNNQQHFPPGIRPVALKAVSEIERARACPHRHASAVQLERARTAERAGKAREDAAKIRFVFPLAEGLGIAGAADAGDGMARDPAETATDDSAGSGGSAADTQVQSGTAGGKSVPPRAKGRKQITRS